MSDLRGREVVGVFVEAQRTALDAGGMSGGPIVAAFCGVEVTGAR